jgi:primosomal protein N' (replication factor Y)
VTSSPDEADHLVAVAVPVPGLGLLSYRVPRPLPAPPKGARVEVPLGQRRVIGCVVDPHASVPRDATIRDVAAVLDVEPFLPAPVVDLALWAGEYYACGPGDVLLMAMPPGARQVRSAFRTTVIAELMPGAALGARAGAKQRAAVAALQRHGALPLEVLAGDGVSGSIVRGLASRGLVRLRSERRERDPFHAPAGMSVLWTTEQGGPMGTRTLTTEQAAALEALGAAAARRQFETVLLHGVTGSGKTELYLRTARQVLADGRQVLVLVPEIALTPAVAGAFRAAFGAAVAIQHSALSDGERHDQWHRIRQGAVRVVVGTRSAVFAPLETVGLIIVDEEHDGAYKQEEAPRYQGRDVAVMRGRMAGALVVLGSATPSLESAFNAAQGRYQLIELKRRVLDRPLASVRIVDMRPEFARQGPDVALSEALREAIADRLARGEQALVLLNRRGFAIVVFCRQCGASIECPHCSVTLTYYRAARRMRCHYCNFATAVPARCGACGGEYLEQSGFCTERLESDLRASFPSARIARVDRDIVRRRGALARALSAVGRGDIDVLVGTQMIAKGHDFPAVTLVGVVSADVGLGLADFRVAERTFQLLTQVVGRAGRGPVAGEALIQTLYPDHYSIRAAAAQDYAAFYAREMEFRQALHYPPVVSLINVIVKGGSLEAALEDARGLADAMRRHQVARVLGPAPAPRQKIRDEYRAQFFIKGTRRRAMREALQAELAGRPHLRKRAIIDVDPLSVT